MITTNADIVYYDITLYTYSIILLSDARDLRDALYE